MVMNCPVCGKEARARVYRCAKCATLVHVACWPKHKATVHPEAEVESKTKPYGRSGRK